MSSQIEDSLLLLQKAIAEGIPEIYDGDAYTWLLDWSMDFPWTPPESITAYLEFAKLPGAHEADEAFFQKYGVRPISYRKESFTADVDFALKRCATDWGSIGWIFEIATLYLTDDRVPKEDQQFVAREMYRLRERKWDDQLTWGEVVSIIASWQTESGFSR